MIGEFVEREESWIGGYRRFSSPSLLSGFIIRQGITEPVRSYLPGLPITRSKVGAHLADPGVVYQIEGAERSLR